MSKTQLKPNSPDALRRVLPWAAALLGVWALSVGLSYYWRVVFQLAGVPLVQLALLPGAVGSLLLLAVFLLRRFFAANVPAAAAACVFVLGLLFCFVTEPLQVPDEPDRFLRAYAISQGHFNYDYTRQYPDDVNILFDSFPHTHNFSVRYGGAQLAPQNFAQYFADVDSGKTVDHVGEPIVRMIVPFLPQAAFMAVARLFGLHALGCMYAARIANLACYTLLCLLAFKNCDR